MTRSNDVFTGVILHLNVVVRVVTILNTSKSENVAAYSAVSVLIHIGKERHQRTMNPACVLSVTTTLVKHTEFGHALDVLEEHLEVIESSFEN